MSGVPATVRTAAGSTDPAACFHCGLPLPVRPFPVVVEGERQDTCCLGCQAVAQTISESGLGAYYRNRSALPSGRPEPAGPAAESRIYDLPEIQRGFVRDEDPAGGDKEAALLLDGITCGACAWLIEQRIATLPGVRSAAVNFVTRRARVRWDSSRIRLSGIIDAVTSLGYGAQPYDAARAEAAISGERRTMLWRLFVAGFGMMQVMMYAVPVYFADGAMTADIEQLMRIASLLLTAPVVLWSALPFYRGALRDLLNRRVGMDVPVAAGILIAFGASAAATLRGTGDVYFDSVTMFVFLLLSARFVDLVARSRAAEAQERLSRLAPALAERFDRFPGGMASTVPAALLVRGDTLLVRPGSVVPADGVAVDGTSAADESLLTGESRPVPKGPGDRLTGGSVNLHSPLVMRVERVGQDTVLAGIVRLMDRALGEKPAIATVADRAARWFVAAQLVLTIAVAMAWYAMDPPRALWIAISLLVVTCPCALSLATPTALTAATGALFGQGLLVGRGHALETLAGATHVVFDKTGTLTDGRMSLVGVIPVGGASHGEALAIAAGLEAGSEHPIGRAIVAAAVTPAEVRDVRNEPGQGMSGMLSGRPVRIGRPEYVARAHGQALPKEWMFVSDDVTVVALGDDRGWIALLTFRDALRRDARRVVRELESSGRTVCLLSGDRGPRVASLARELGIALYVGDATPESKLAFVRDLQSRGAVVVMIGDGVNDAPVLAQAQTSIALGRGTDLAKSSADMVLMGERLQPVITAVSLARRTLGVVRQNLMWAVAYNAVAVPLAAMGEITPLWAAVGMSVSSLVVVLNALRLQRMPAARRVPRARLTPVAA